MGRTPTGTIRSALSLSVGNLLGLLASVSQLFGAFNALWLNWIGIATDLKSYAAGLSTLISIGGFILGWVHSQEPISTEYFVLRKKIAFALIGMIISFVSYWLLNVFYSTGSPNQMIDVSARLGFLLLYSLPFGFLCYSLGIISGLGQAPSTS